MLYNILVASFFFLPLLPSFWALSPVVTESYWFSVFFCHVIREVLPTLVQVPLPLNFSNCHCFLLEIPCFQTSSLQPIPLTKTASIFLSHHSPQRFSCGKLLQDRQCLGFSLAHQGPPCVGLPFLSSLDLYHSQLCFGLDNFLSCKHSAPTFQQVFAPVNYFFPHFLTFLYG